MKTTDKLHESGHSFCLDSLVQKLLTVDKSEDALCFELANIWI